MKRLMAFVAAIGVLSSCTNSVKNNNIETTHLQLANSFVQKGPFIQGSNVTIQELDNNYEATGKSYSTKTSDDFGSFSFSGDLTSQSMEIITTGYYFDEVAGKLSDGPLSLRVYIDVTAPKANVNILTTLSSDRIKYLIVNNKMSFDSAKVQSEHEILRIFNIPDTIISGLSGFESFDISQPGVGNAILLAVSAVLQGNNTPAQLSELISKMTSDIMTNGKLVTANLISALKTNSAGLDLNSVRSNLEKRYTDLGVTKTIPEFEKYVDSDTDGIINKWDYILTSPADTISASKPLFKWTASELPDVKYHFQISSKSDFTTIFEEDSTLTTNSYMLMNSLSNKTTYYWRVLVTGINQTAINWTGSLQITTDLGTLITISPADSGYTNSQNPLFIWSKNANAASYKLVLSKNSDLSSPILTKTGLTDTNYTFTGQQLTSSPSQTYYWAVTPIDSNGVSGTASSIARFTLDTEKPTGTITINGGELYTITTKVSIALTASDSSKVTYMRLAESSGSLSTVHYDTFMISSTFNLSGGNGVKTIFAQFKDASGNESAVASISSSITLEKGFVYVATTGNDNNSGTRQNPKLTIQAGIDSAASSDSVIIVRVAAGVYTITNPISVPNGVTVFGGYSATNWNASRDAAANLTNIQINTVGSSGAQTAFSMTGTSYSTCVDGFWILFNVNGGGGFRQCFDVQGTAQISNNIVSATTNNFSGFCWGVRISGGSPLIFNNIFYNKNADYVIDCRDGSKALIVNNDLIGITTTRSGIVAWDVSAPQAINNIFYNFESAITEMEVGVGPIVVKNNNSFLCTTFYSNLKTGATYTTTTIDSLSGTIASNNVNIDLTPYLTNWKGADGDLSTISDNDWTLNNAAPNSITQGGLNESTYFTTDKAGVTRSHWSIGAYEK